MANPTLGYPTRSDAIEALRAQGLGTGAIAARLGVSGSTIRAHENARAQSRRRGGAGWVPHPVAHPARRHEAALDRAASARGVTVNRLLTTIIAAVVEGGLIDAVLDDRIDDQPGEAS